jgi:bla regulator protein blaR1
MYRFNRFYLLFSIVFSFTVSFITIKVAAPIMPVQETIVLTGNNLPAIHTAPNITPIETTDYLTYLLPAFYFIVSSFLLYRFIRNLLKLLSKIKGNKIVSYSGARLVLTNNNDIPFSFLNFIFINKEKYERGTIEKEVMQHELTHVKQMHSVDVILIELFIALAWFNPLLFLFRRSILLNHEFLADESVVETFNDAKSYQLLLFKKANRKNNLILTSSFNYLITKKRLIMMTRKTSQKVAIVKQIAIIPLIAALGFLFSTKVVAQENTTQSNKKQIEVTKKDSVKENAVQQKINLDQKQVSESRLEQKVKLDKEQRVLLDQQKKELDNKQNSKSPLDQKVKLDKEQQVEMNLQKVKMEKEMRTMTKEQIVKMKDEEAKMMDQKVKMEKDMEVKMKDQKVMMKDQEAKIIDQKIKMEKEMQAKMKDQKEMMKDQEAKMKEEKIKLEQEQKAKQEQK